MIVEVTAKVHFLIHLPSIKNFDQICEDNMPITQSDKMIMDIFYEKYPDIEIDQITSVDIPK